MVVISNLCGDMGFMRVACNRVFCYRSDLLVSGSWFVVVVPDGFSGMVVGGGAMLLKSIGIVYV